MCEGAHWYNFRVKTNRYRTLVATSCSLLLCGRSRVWTNGSYSNFQAATSLESFRQTDIRDYPAILLLQSDSLSCCPLGYVTKVWIEFIVVFVLYRSRLDRYRLRSGLRVSISNITKLRPKLVAIIVPKSGRRDNIVSTERMLYELCQ